jgi:hypothetical protein
MDSSDAPTGAAAEAPAAAAATAAAVVLPTAEVKPLAADAMDTAADDEGCQHGGDVGPEKKRRTPTMSALFQIPKFTDEVLLRYMEVQAAYQDESHPEHELAEELFEDAFLHRRLTGAVLREVISQTSPDQEQKEEEFLNVMSFMLDYQAFEQHLADLTGPPSPKTAQEV